jgi:hypothetical protein
MNWPKKARAENEMQGWLSRAHNWYGETGVTLHFVLVTCVAGRLKPATLFFV